MAFSAVSAVAGKTNVGKFDGAGLRRGSTVNDERLAQLIAGMNPVDEALVVDVFRRQGAFRRLSLVAIGLCGVVAHDAKFGVPPCLSVGGEARVADVAILDLDRLSSRHRLFVGNGKILDDVVTNVPDVFDDVAVGLLHFSVLDSLDADGPGAGGVSGQRVSELMDIDTVALRLGFAHVFFNSDFVIHRRPGEHEAEIIHLPGVYRIASLVFYTKCDRWVLPRHGPFDTQDVKDDARELGRPAGKRVGSGDRRTKFRPLGLMATETGSLSLGTDEMILARLKIDVVMTGQTRSSGGEILPVILLGARVQMASLAVSQVLEGSFRGYHLRVTQVRVVGDSLTGSDQ